MSDNTQNPYSPGSPGSASSTSLPSTAAGSSTIIQPVVDKDGYWKPEYDPESGGFKCPYCTLDSSMNNRGRKPHVYSTYWTCKKHYSANSCASSAFLKAQQDDLLQKNGKLNNYEKSRLRHIDSLKSRADSTKITEIEGKLRLVVAESSKMKEARKIEDTQNDEKLILSIENGGANSVFEFQKIENKQQSNKRQQIIFRALGEVDQEDGQSLLEALASVGESVSVLINTGVHGSVNEKTDPPSNPLFSLNYNNNEDEQLAADELTGTLSFFIQDMVTAGKFKNLAIALNIVSTNSPPSYSSNADIVIDLWCFSGYFPPFWEWTRGDLFDSIPSFFSENFVAEGVEGRGHAKSGAAAAQKKESNDEYWKTALKDRSNRFIFKLDESGSLINDRETFLRLEKKVQDDIKQSQSSITSADLFDSAFDSVCRYDGGRQLGNGAVVVDLSSQKMGNVQLFHGKKTGGHNNTLYLLFHDDNKKQHREIVAAVAHDEMDNNNNGKSKYTFVSAVDHLHGALPNDSVIFHSAKGTSHLLLSTKQIKNWGTTSHEKFHNMPRNLKDFFFSEVKSGSYGDSDRKDSLGDLIDKASKNPFVLLENIVEVKKLDAITEEEAELFGIKLHQNDACENDTGNAMNQRKKELDKLQDLITNSLRSNTNFRQEVERRRATETNHDDGVEDEEEEDQDEKSGLKMND